MASTAFEEEPPGVLTGLQRARLPLCAQRKADAMARCGIPPRSAFSVRQNAPKRANMSGGAVTGASRQTAANGKDEIFVRPKQQLARKNA